MISQFADKLKTALNSLPGARAQEIMMPKESTRARFDLSKKDVRRGAVLVLFYPYNEKIYIPLTQRHDYDGTHSGQVSLPGGKWEDVDESIESTALRETKEEIGVSPSDITVIGKLTDLYIAASNFRVAPFVGYVKEKPTFKVDTFEVKELIETPLDFIINSQYRKRKHIYVREKMKLEAPYFDVLGKTVWGATAMMLSELAEVIKAVELK